jgi:hypothetical protein
LKNFTSPALCITKYTIHQHYEHKIQVGVRWDAMLPLRSDYNGQDTHHNLRALTSFFTFKSPACENALMDTVPNTLE